MRWWWWWLTLWHKLIYQLMLWHTRAEQTSHSHYTWSLFLSVKKNIASYFPLRLTIVLNRNPKKWVVLIPDLFATDILLRSSATVTHRWQLVSSTQLFAWREKNPKNAKSCLFERYGNNDVATCTKWPFTQLRGTCLPVCLFEYFLTFYCPEWQAPVPRVTSA